MRRALSRFLFVVALLADTILFLYWLRPDHPHSLLPVQVLQALFFNSYLFWRITVPIVGALGLTVLTERIRGNAL